LSKPVILVPLDEPARALAAPPMAKVPGEIEHAVLQLLQVAEGELPDADRLGDGAE
jgi:hypothetical protein